MCIINWKYKKGDDILLKVIVLFLLITNMYSNSNKNEIKIHDVIAKEIFHKDTINTYISSEELNSKIQKYSKYIISSKIENSKYIILSDDIKIANSNVILFVTSYSLLKTQKNAIGAFYWKKNRPTIIFIKERLEKKGITLSDSFKKYYEDEKCLYELCF